MESKKVEFFNNLSFFTLLVTIFGCLFFFIPYVSITVESSKGFLLAVGSMLSLLFWLISRLGDGKFLIPKDKLILFALALPVVFLLSSLFSSSFYISFLGNGFEIGTFGSMLVLFILFFLSTIHFQSEKRLWYFVGSFFISGIIIFLFELLNVFVGFDTFLPGFTRGLSAGNLVGNWTNFALIIGLLVLLSVLTLESLKINKLFRVIGYILMGLGLVFLVILNISFIWLMVGIFATIIFVYNISLQRSGVNMTDNENNKRKFPFTSLTVVFVSLIFLIGSNSLGVFVSKYVSLNNPDINIRPSIVTTSQIAYKSFLHNPLLGTGPNTFTMDWSLWHPKVINQTIFWNVDFTSGFSLLTTFLVTTGLLGFIAMLLFLITYLVRSAQSIRIALQNMLSNYFIMTTLLISLYSWLIVIFYNPNIVMLMLAFVSSGVLVGILVYKQAIPVKEFSFLSDPRNSFFSILGLLILMVLTISLSYLYIEKFTSVLYFSNSINNENSLDALSKKEKLLSKAIMLDKNDIYYRNLSQVYISEINLLIGEKGISEDILKSELQQLVNLAQEKAQLAINRNPKQYLNHVNLGNVYSSLVPLSVVGSYERALVAYNQALVLAPNNPAIIFAKASLEFLNKNNTEAKSLINQALEMKPNYVDAIFLLAQIETNEGNLSEAIKQAEYASSVAPNDPTVFFRLGLLRYKNTDYNGAISAFEKAVIQNNNYLNARYFLGESYRKVGRLNDALVQFEILSKVDPNNQDIKNAINSIKGIDQTKEIDSKDETKVKPPLEEKQ